MKVSFCADDSNNCTKSVISYLQNNHELIEVSDPSWVDMAKQVGHLVAEGKADFGVVMCWTGTGVAIAANKVDGIRAAQASDAWIAKNARLWNDANVLALSLKRLSPDDAVDCVKAFLSAEKPDPDEASEIAKLG